MGALNIFKKFFFCLCCEWACTCYLQGLFRWIAWKDSWNSLPNKVYTTLHPRICRCERVYSLSWAYAALEQAASLVCLSSVRSDNWEGQRWTHWFVAVSKIIEQFLSVMLAVCRGHVHAHTHTSGETGLLRTGCSLELSSNNEALNRSHQSLSREILLSCTFLTPLALTVGSRGMCVFSACVCMWSVDCHILSFVMHWKSAKVHYWDIKQPLTGDHQLYLAVVAWMVE